MPEKTEERVQLVLDIPVALRDLLVDVAGINKWDGGEHATGKALYDYAETIFKNHKGPHRFSDDVALQIIAGNVAEEVVRAVFEHAVKVTLRDNPPKPKPKRTTKKAAA